MTDPRPRHRPGTAAAAVLLLLGTACGGAAAETPGAQTGDDAASGPPGDDGTVGIRAGLERAGLTRAPEQETAGFLVEGQTVVHEVRAPSGGCLTLTVRGAAGLRDVDTTLYAPDGAPLAEDIEPDAHPTIQVCAGPDRPRRAHLVVSALAGQGDYRLLAYVGPRDSMPAARAVVGGRPGVAAGAPAGDDDGPSQAVGSAIVRFSNAVERIGFAPSGSPVRLVGPPAGVSLERPLGAVVGRCYTVAAFHPPGKRPATLTLVDAWGSPRVVSDPADDHAALQWCAGETAPHAVRIEGLAPGSPVVLGIWVAEASAVGGGRDLWLGRPPDPAGALRRDARTRAARALEAEGFPGLRRLDRGQVPAGGAATVRLPRTRGRPGSRCRAVVVAPEGPLAEVTVAFSDERPGGAALPDGGHVAVDCTGRPRTLRVHVRRGAGAFELWLAVARREPWGVWGGQMFLNGRILTTKRRRGRPPRSRAPAAGYFGISEFSMSRVSCSPGEHLVRSLSSPSALARARTR